MAQKIIENCVVQLKCTKEEALIYWQEFEKFLDLKRVLKDYQGEIVIPSPIIDKVWRLSILCTTMYPSLCGEHFLHYKIFKLTDQNCWIKYLQTVSNLQEKFDYVVDSAIWPTVLPTNVAVDRPTIKCKQCPKQFATKGLLVTHIQIVHQISFHFTYPDGYTGVYLKFEKNKPICPRCKKSFSSGKSLQQHTRYTCKASFK